MCLPGLPIPQLVQSQPNWETSPKGLPGLPIPQLVQSKVSISETSYCLPGLPIPQLVQYSVLPRRVARSLPGLPIPQLVQYDLSVGRWCHSLPGLPIPQLVQFHDLRRLAAEVFPAFQFPSWYNTGTKKAPANRGFLGKDRQRNDVYMPKTGHPFAVFQNPLTEKRIAHRSHKVRWAYLAGNHSNVIPLSTR